MKSLETVCEKALQKTCHGLENQVYCLVDSIKPIIPVSNWDFNTSFVKVSWCTVRTHIPRIIFDFLLFKKRRIFLCTVKSIVRR